jgi:hypothetical protein
MKTLITLLIVCGALLIAPAFAQDAKPEPVPSLAGRPDADADELLGGNYQNPTAGIAFRTPSNCKQVKGNADEIVRFVNEQRHWEVIASRGTAAEPLPLIGDGKGKLGLLEVVVARLKQSNPTIEVVRQDKVSLGDADAGMIAARFTAGAQRRLIQEALIQANDQLYYTLTMTSLASKTATGADSTDPLEVAAVNAFKLVVDSVKLLDRANIKDDQNERLFRTRALFVNLTPEKIKSALIHEQWMRLTREGKDVGYTYTVEEADNSAGRDGIKIGVRSRSYPQQNSQVDAETWYYVSGDSRHENWSNLVWVQDLAHKTADQVTELGSSDKTFKKIVIGQPPFPKGQNPPVEQMEVYTLEVQTVGKQANVQPLKQDLPPWYLPQALSHLLPRLLPLRTPKTYLFAVYVADGRKVMHRYVDVGSEQTVELNGERVRAVPITDRLTLEGSTTIHYMSPEGKYLGSVNKDSKVAIVPTDAATLQKLWANKADLSRPSPGPQQQQPQQQEQPQQPQQPPQPSATANP